VRIILIQRFASNKKYASVIGYSNSVWFNVYTGIILKNILLFIAISVSTVFIFAQAIPEKIIGENDLVIVNKEASNIPFRYQKLVNAFGNVMYNEVDADGKLTDSYYGCTGTHMGNGYIIMAGHCVGATSVVTSQENCHFIQNDNPLISSQVHISTIDFGYREEGKPLMRSECQQIVAAMYDPVNGIDFAIVKVSTYPAEFILPDTKRRTITGDTLTIFSHPEGEVLQWSKTCGVERILHPELSSSFIHHKCDTKPGSSGAAIINVLSLRIVGVHDGGWNDFDIVTGLPLKSGMNSGTYILSSPLYNALKNIGF
jgi:hypothetical protein